MCIDIISAKSKVDIIIVVKIIGKTMMILVKIWTKVKRFVF